LILPVLHSLGGNLIGDEGTAAIGEALKHNRTLAKLKWVCRMSFIPVFSFFPLARALPSSVLFLIPHSLLDISVGDEGAAAIAKGLTHNMTLTELR
jgi:hypothetical protein